MKTYLYIACGLAILLYFLYIPFRVVINHPVSVAFYGFLDMFNWIKKKMYNYYPAGKLDCYAAHFGGGKTLSIVHYVTAIYKRYNNRKVWDKSLKCFVRQKIHIISNVEFSTIPFQRLVSLEQVVNMCMHNKELDKMTHERTVILVVIDEASAQLNSRNFKSNIDTDFLNTLITSRHYHMSILYSSQKFKLTDKLMRDVTQRVIQCKKIWRIMIQNVYNADELEFASDPSLVRPIERKGWFIRNKDYSAYDTLAVVDKLKKDIDEGNMLSPAEILQLRENTNPDNDNIIKGSGRLRRLQNRRKRKGA